MNVIDIVKELDFEVEHTVDEFNNIVYEKMVYDKKLKIRFSGSERFISISVQFGCGYSGCSFIVNREFNLNNGKHVAIVKNDIMDIVGQLKASTMSLSYFIDAVEGNPLV